MISRALVSSHVRCESRRTPAIESLEARTLLAGSGLTGAYFARTNLTATKFARVDAAIDFDWASTPAARTLGTDGFSVRWSGKVMPKFSETYTFIATTTGGIRLWVDNKLLIDRWSVHAPSEYAASTRLQAAALHDIRIDYYGDGSRALAKLEWQSKRRPREPVPTGRMYPAIIDDIAPKAPPKLRTTYVSDTTIKFIWNGSSDPSGVVAYDVYMGKTKLASTTTNLPEMYLVRNKLTPATSYSFSVNAIDAAGNMSPASPITVTTANPVVGAGGLGIAAAYYASTDFTNFRLTRTDPTIDFSWQGLQSTSLGTDTSLSVRWSGQLLSKYSETYTIYTVSDDGVRLWINDKLLINNWTAHPRTENSAQVKLYAGTRYDIKLEYYRADQSGVVSLLWSSISQAKQVIPQSQLFPAFVDSSPPSAPASLKVDATTLNTASLSWSAATDDVGVAKYLVYRNGQLLTETTGYSYTDTGLQSGTTYAYAVAAVDGVPRTGPQATVQATTQYPPPRDAYSRLVASSFQGAWGIDASGEAIINLDDGDWVKYQRLDFGGGPGSVRMEVAVPTNYAVGRIEMRLDATTGPIVGTLCLQPTGGYSTYYTQRASISGASGVRDLYLVFRGRTAMGNLRALTFSTQSLKRVMALGDSITQQSGLSPSYRYYLWHRLIGAGKGVDFVGSSISAWDGSPPNLDFDQNHEGHSGWRADQIADGVAGWISSASPQFVLLHIGTNDLLDGQSVESTLDDIARIIDNIRNVNSSIQILLAQIIPGSGIESQVAELNAGIAALATSKSVRLVDQYSGFSVESDTRDGLHPNSNGDIKIADRWFDALAPLL